jgi:hypothetical protein
MWYSIIADNPAKPDTTTIVSPTYANTVIIDISSFIVIVLALMVVGIISKNFDQGNHPYYF